MANADTAQVVMQSNGFEIRVVVSASGLCIALATLIFASVITCVLGSTSSGNGVCVTYMTGFAGSAARTLTGSKASRNAFICQK